jgi:hypothetical protein
MDQLRRPRSAALVGVLFAVIGVVYWVVQAGTGFAVDYAGVTMLLLLGIAMSIMCYVLIAGSSSGE